MGVTTRNWLRDPLYTAADLPKPKEKFSKPSAEDRRRHPTKPEPFAISRRVLIEMCRGRELSSLPTEVQDVLASAPGIENLLREDSRKTGSQMVVVAPDSMVLDQPQEQPLQEGDTDSTPQTIRRTNRAAAKE